MAQASKIQGSAAIFCFCAAALAFSAGCASKLAEGAWIASDHQSPTLELEGGGSFRTSLWRDQNSPVWNVLSIRNSGPVAVHGLRFWNYRKSSLVLFDDGSAEEPRPFSLLPGEQFVLTETVESQTGIARLTGIFYWDWPAQFAAAPWPGRSARMKDWGPHGIQLTAGPDQAHAEVTLDSPLPLAGLRVGWEAPATALTVAPFVSSDLRVWARPGTYHPNVGLARPADLNTFAAGKRRIGLRIAADAPEGRAGAVVLSKIRVERDFQVVGKLAEWESGENIFRIDFKKAPGAMLTLRLEAF